MRESLAPRATLTPAVLDALLSGSTDYAALRPDRWAAAHPEAIREYRREERRDQVRIVYRISFPLFLQTLQNIHKTNSPERILHFCWRRAESSAEQQLPLREASRRFVRKKSLQKFKDAIRAKTKRTNGTSLTAIVASLNPTLRGWFGYFKQAYRTTFPDVDRWVRGRLRSVLRHRSGRRGRGRGYDHQRWPNKFFHQHGLYSLSHARQSCLR